MKEIPAEKATRILIVDDEVNVCTLLSRILSPEGYACTVASSGEEAIRLLEKERFHLVISDIVMPGVSGIDLLGVINRLFPETAVLMVTAVDDRETGLIAVELGAYGYIIKPFTTNEILISVASALRRLCERRDSADFEAKAEKGRLDTSSGPSEARIEMDEAAECIRMGMDDASLMERFDLSSEGLQRLFRHLVAMGQLSQSNLDHRPALSPGTVALDRPPSDLVDRGILKPSISAKEAVACIKAGMDDLALMKRYGISATGLRSLFNKLLDSGYLKLDELYEATRVRVESLLAHELSELPRRYLAVTVPIRELGRPEAEYFLVDITEKGVGIRGIEVEVGDMKTFEIATRGFIEVETIRFDALCLWVRKQDTGIEAVAGFQITNISDQSLEAFRHLVRLLAFIE